MCRRGSRVPLLRARLNLPRGNRTSGYAALRAAKFPRAKIPYPITACINSIIVAGTLGPGVSTLTMYEGVFVGG